MTEEAFKAHYVATFLATYAAMHYDEACAHGRHDRLEKHHSAEDAKYLADKAWEAFQSNTSNEVSR